MNDSSAVVALLPSLKSSGPLRRILSTLGMIVVAMAILSLLGWIFGRIHHQIKRQQIREEIVALTHARGRLSLEEQIHQLERYRDLVPQNYQIRQSLAVLHTALALESLPDSEHQAAALRQIKNARALLKEAFPSKPLEDQPDNAAVVRFFLDEALVFDQAKLLPQTKALYERLLAWDDSPGLPGENPGDVLFLKARLYNNAAMFYALSAGEEERDPVKAMDLISRAIKSYPAASSDPVFLDTLAIAYFAQGDSLQALKIQKKILAIAEGEELSPFLDNYYLFQRASTDQGHP